MLIIQRLVFWCVVLLPWLAALYLHYWLDQSDSWWAELPYRGLMSVLILALGMVISFLLHGRLRKRFDT